MSTNVFLNLPGFDAQEGKSADWTTVKHEHDGYMPEGSAQAYLRDLPNAELHLLDGGHWTLETNLGEIVVLVRDFLGHAHT